MKLENNALFLGLKVRCALRSLTENQLQLGRCNITRPEHVDGFLGVRFGIASSSEGADVYLDTRNIRHLGSLTMNALCEILLLHWAEKRLRSRPQRDILKRNLIAFSDSSNAQEFLSKIRIEISAIQWGDQGQGPDCPCRNMSRRVDNYNKKVEAPSRTAGKHQGLSLRRLEEFYHGPC